MIELPNGWAPRGYQLPLWSYLERGGKRAIAVWHRRSGKDDVALNWTAVAANDVGAKESIGRIGTYWHMLPEAAQARKAIWEAVNPHTGKRRIDEAFPKALRANTREDNMFIRFTNGSTWQVVGSDNFNSLVGSPPTGVVFSEWALANPAAWAYLRPILAENGGWALFITTPRGRNHAHTMFQGAKKDPNWFCQSLPATDTTVFAPEQLTSERAEYVREYGEGNGDNLFEQEYLCSFEAAILGAYWGKEMAQAEREGRITSVPYDPDLPVHTAWDIGIDDSTAIWFFQIPYGGVRVIDFYQNSGFGAEHYVRVIEGKEAAWRVECEARGQPGQPPRWRQGEDWMPHDAKAREWGSGRTRIETIVAMNRKPRLVPDHDVQDGINAARQTMRRSVFDEERCAAGVEALRQYRTQYDEINRVFLKTPKHDWTSHAADAFRYLAMAWRELTPPAPPPPPITTIQDVTMDRLWRDQDRRRSTRI